MFILWANNIISMNLCCLAFKTMVILIQCIHHVWRQIAYFAPLIPILFHFCVKPCIFTDNVNKSLFAPCDDVTVGWWCTSSCIILFHTVVKHFALSECTFFMRIVSLNNPILFISVQSSLPQIIKAEKPVDLFNVVYGYRWVKITLPTMTSLRSSKPQKANKSTWSDLSNIDGLVNSVAIYIFYKLLLEYQQKFC